MENYYYDVIIIGGGPAGLSSGIYTSRAKLNTLIIERDAFGGQAMNINLIENYPGFPEGISGPDLGSKILSQAVNCGANLLFDKVISIEIQNKSREKIIRTKNHSYKAKALIISSGSKQIRLGVRGEDKFFGKGVTYCAVCDAGRFKDKVGIVVGAGDSGVTEALYLAKFAERIFIIEFLPKPSASPILLERVQKNPRIEIHCNTKIISIEGDSELKGVLVHNLESGKEYIIDASEVLVHIGISPNIEFIPERLNLLDTSKRIVVNKFMETKVRGIFAAGDIRSDSLWQLSCATGDGIIAALSADKYINEL